MQKGSYVRFTIRGLFNEGRVVQVNEAGRVDIRHLRSGRHYIRNIKEVRAI